MRILPALALVLVLPGCATIMEGTSQSVAVSTNPAGAACGVDREGGHLGAILSTPGSVRVDKSKDDLTVSCSKTGYQTASVSESPKFVGTTFGNIVIGGLVGAAVDAATGANYEYPTEVHLDLAPTLSNTPVTMSAASPLRAHWI
jgi:hypothetical protein